MRARFDSRGPVVRLVAALVAAGAWLALLAAIRLDALPWLRGPAPYPPEWQWGYRPVPLARLLPAALVACGTLACLAASGIPRARSHPRAAARLLLAAAFLGGVVFQLALLEREPRGALRALMARAISPSISSYHAVAVSEAGRDPAAFLRAHARLLPRLAQGSKHAATHPPGPVLWYRGALALCERSAMLTDRLLAAAGVARRASQSEEGRAIRAAALLGALGLTVLGVLTLWPLAALAEALGWTPLPAARLAVLWTLLPGPALMTPALDATVAFAVTGSLALLVRAGHGASPRRAWLLATLAGAGGGVAMFTSYGAMGFLALGGLAVLAASTEERPRFRRAAGACLLAGALTALLAFGLPGLLGHQPLLALRNALEVHRALFTAPRDYLLWLAFDPLDFVFFLGLPVAAASLWALGGSLARGMRGARLDSLDRPRLAFATGLIVLLLFGVTRGEVGRLWIPLMPLALVSAAAGHERPGAVETTVLALLVALQTLVTASCWLV
jgi:hypothetical protein